METPQPDFDQLSSNNFNSIGRDKIQIEITFKQYFRCSSSAISIDNGVPRGMAMFW